MKFILEVDMSRLSGEADAELGRILRYWAGAMKQMELTNGAGSAIYDSEYQPVGHWIITDEPDA